MARIDLGKVVGDSATISVGNVTTLEAGQNATVVNTGTELNGVFDFGIPKGPKGDKGDTGSQGPVGPQGVQGKAFTIDKTYSSVLDMQADLDNMEVGSYVMIASNVESEDNARLYYRDTNEWKFISDFSGATGIQGEQGPQGAAGYTPVKGVDYFTSADIAEIEGDIKDITGELDNLSTTDKSNLVNAINEVASAGGGEQIPTLVLDEPYRFVSGGSVTDSDMLSFFSTRITEMLTETPKKGLILIEYNNSGKSELWCCTENVSSQSTQYNFYLVNTEIKSANYKYALAVRGAWANGTFTCSYIMTVQDNYSFVLPNQVLTKTNNDSYTPTGNYNPATKKYVDDAVASASGESSKTYVIEDYTKNWTTDSESIAKFNSWYQDYLNGIVSEFVIKTTIRDNTSYSNIPKTFRLVEFDIRGAGDNMIFSSMKDLNYYPARYYFSVNLNISNGQVTSLNTSTGQYINGIQIVPTSAYNLSQNGISFALTTNNTSSYTPTSNYHPATKKYVDDSIAAAITTTLGGSY